MFYTFGYQLVRDVKNHLQLGHCLELCNNLDEALVPGRDRYVGFICPSCSTPIGPDSVDFRDDWFWERTEPFIWTILLDHLEQPNNAEYAYLRDPFKGMGLIRPLVVSKYTRIIEGVDDIP